MPVPSGIGFYSAHFKAEAYDYFSGLKEDYVGLIDNDIICINSIPLCLTNLAKSQTALHYDITEQIFPAHGQERVLADKKLVDPKTTFGLWSGGEFIMGPPAFFKRLYQEINLFQDNYFKVYKQLRHTSDEVLTSVGVENLINSASYPITDAGKLKIIGRHWSAKTLHVQNKLEYYRDCFLLHLPSDKHFLASLADKNIPNDQIMQHYEQHLKTIQPSYYSRLFGEKTVSSVKRLIGKA